MNVSASATMRMPNPNWMPETTVRGTTRFTSSTRPVAPRIKTAPPTNSPAAAVSPALRPSAIAAAAMVFIGWTGIGRSHWYAPTMLKRPIQKSAAASLIAPTSAMASSNGRSVPRSPSMPEHSSHDHSARNASCRSRTNAAASRVFAAMLHAASRRQLHALRRDDNLHVLRRDDDALRD